MPGLRAAVLKKSGFLDERGAGNLPGTLDKALERAQGMAGMGDSS